MSIPRFSNEVWEGRVVKPHCFQAEWARAKVEGSRVSVDEDKVMVGGCSVEVEDGGWWFQCREASIGDWIAHSQGIS